MPITHDKHTKWALLSAPYREGETVRQEEVQYATEEDLRAAGWRPAAEVGLQISMIGRQMLEQLWTALGYPNSEDNWEEALLCVEERLCAARTTALLDAANHCDPQQRVVHRRTPSIERPGSDAWTVVAKWLRDEAARKRTDA